MPENNSGNFQIPWPTLVAAISALGGLVWYLGPLNSDRPTGSVGTSIKPPGYQEVDARLWQDPLDLAIEAAQGDGKERPPAWLAPVASAMGWKPAREHQPAQVLMTVPRPPILMPVMLESGRYADSVERRRRERFAVVNALNQAKYAPWDSMHIGYLEIDAWPAVEPGPKTGAPTLSPRTLVVPFEWFLRKGAAADFLLVLWLDDGEFADAPLVRLQELIAPIVKQLKIDTIKLIGPRGSNSLMKMRDEAANQPGLDADLWRLTHIFSPTATVPNEILNWSETPTKTGLRSREQLEFFKTFSAHLHRTVDDDLDVCAALVNELKRRNVTPRTGNTAIISEWDTLYGRSLQVSFMAAMRGGRCNLRGAYLECISQVKPTTDFTPYMFSYLRGVDGRSAHSSDQKPDSRTSDGPNEKPKSVDPLNFLEPASEAPEGDYQYDYLRRLAENLDHLDRNDRLEHGYLNGGLEAIGVLGSDVYDKLIILQALRPRFPNAIFFTTDLDARLGNQAERSWAQNLVVASSYGLEVCKTLQSDSPPFRDGGQTAVYCATLAAMNFIGASSTESLGHQPVALFEIGRSGPFYFGAEPVAGPSRAEVSVQPEPEEPLIWWHGIHTIGLISCALLAIGLLRLLRSMRNEETRIAGFKRNRLSLYIIVVVAFGIGAVMIGIGVQDPMGALPFLWFEGISIWPSELIRATAAILGICLLDRGCGLLTQNVASLSATYTQKLTGSLAKSWRKYRKCGQLKKRTKRAAKLFAMYFLFALFLALVFGIPPTPARGVFSRVTSHAILILAVCVFVFLTFFVVDATELAIQCVREAAPYPPPHWQPTSDLPTELEDVRFIAGLTKPIMSLIYAPFFVLTLLIIARLRIFANWTWPWSMILIFSINSLWAVYAAMRLRRASEAARQRAIRGLSERRLKWPNSSEQLKLAIESISGLREGAFASFLNDPIIGAVLLPCGAALLTILSSRGGS